MAHLVHNAFYELAVFQAHKLFFDYIYWSYSFCRIVGVFYLDFNRHDIQIDKTRRLFPDRTISSPPSNAWQFASQRNQSTVITNAITDVIKRSTWIRSNSTYVTEASVRFNFYNPSFECGIETYLIQVVLLFRRHNFSASHAIAGPFAIPVNSRHPEELVYTDLALIPG